MYQNYIKYNTKTASKSTQSFTGKERDSETGFSYFGARYYDSDLMTGWLSVDPMADKYPSLSPYAYCAWNPIKLVDPDGEDWYEIENNETKQKEIKWTSCQSQKEMTKNGLKGKYLGKTHLSNSTYYSLYGAEVEYSNDNATSMLLMSNIMNSDNQIIATINTIEGTKDFWDKHNDLINICTNMGDFLADKSNSKYLKKFSKHAGAASLVLSIPKYQESFRNGTWNDVPNLISMASDITSFIPVYGAIISTYLSGVNWAAKKGTEFEFFLRDYFSPQNMVKKYYGL